MVNQLELWLLSASITHNTLRRWGEVVLNETGYVTIIVMIIK